MVVSGLLVMALKDALAVASRLCVGFSDIGVFTRNRLLSNKSCLCTHTLGAGGWWHQPPSFVHHKRRPLVSYNLSEKRKNKKDPEQRPRRSPLRNPPTRVSMTPESSAPTHDYARALGLKLLVRPGRLRSYHVGLLQPWYFFTLVTPTQDLSAPLLRISALQAAAFGSGTWTQGPP